MVKLAPTVNHHLVLHQLIYMFKCGLRPIIIVGNYAYYSVYGSQLFFKCQYRGSIHSVRCTCVFSVAKSRFIRTTSLRRSFIVVIVVAYIPANYSVDDRVR